MSQIDEIKQKISIIDVVSQYVRLEKSGSQFRARCPFHNEKSPSFYVSPSRSGYHCFGCGEHGDIFSFLQKIENLEFKEALKVLADKTGVTLTYEKKEDSSNLISILEFAKKYWQKNLDESINPKKYIHERGLAETTIGIFEVGFAKKEWQDLYNALIKQKFSNEDILESGLIFKTDDGKYLDRFRGRIMFPIRNATGVTVGFTGRIMPEYDDGKSGKYVNTPETKLYHKSQVLFNFDLAKKSIAEKSEVILVEGQMDAIMSYQSGVKNVVAVSGTSFTEDHVKIISRLADNAVLCFDSDAAGEKASNRAAVMCAYGGLQVYRINLNQKDPADLVKENPELWVGASQSKKDMVEFYANDLKRMDAVAKIKYTKDIVVPFLKAIQSPIERSFKIGNFAKMSGIEESAIKQEIDKFVPENEFNKINENVSVNKIDEIKPQTKSDLETEIFALAKHFNKDLKEISLTFEEEFPDEIIEMKMMEMEKKHAVSELYFNDLVKKYKEMNKKEAVKKLKDRIKEEGESEELMKELMGLLKS
jgi:DNA primase